MASKHYVYILRCKDDSLYTGYTTNMARRVKMHETGKGAKYTRGRGPFTIMYQEEFVHKSEAMQQEYAIKQLSRQEKLALIARKKEGTKNEDSK